MSSLVPAYPDSLDLNSSWLALWSGDVWTVRATCDCRPPALLRCYGTVSCWCSHFPRLCYGHPWLPAFPPSWGSCAPPSWWITRCAGSNKAGSWGVTPEILCEDLEDRFAFCELLLELLKSYNLPCKYLTIGIKSRASGSEVVMATAAALPVLWRAVVFY